MTTNQVVNYIYQAKGQRVTHYNNQLLDPAALQVHVDDIRRAVSALLTEMFALLVSPKITRAPSSEVLIECMHLRSNRWQYELD